MLRLETAVIDKLVSQRAFSRSIWIDAENVNGPDGNPVATELVLRGWDKVLVGAKPSESSDAANRKEHKPSLAWNDESAKPRRFVLATFDNAQDAEACAAQLTEFYASADDDALPFSVRFNVLGEDAKRIIPALLALFGAQPNSEQLASANRIGSYADYQSGKLPKPKKESKRAQREAELVAQAKREALAEMSALLANQNAISALTAQSGAANLQDQLAALLAKLQTA